MLKGKSAAFLWTKRIAGPRPNQTPKVRGFLLLLVKKGCGCVPGRLLLFDGKHRSGSGPPRPLDTYCGNDPSAGSPTETLLRLQLPLDDKI